MGKGMTVLAIVINNTDWDNTYGQGFTDSVVRRRMAEMVVTMLVDAGADRVVLSCAGEGHNDNIFEEDRDVVIVLHHDTNSKLQNVDHVQRVLSSERVNATDYDKVFICSDHTLVSPQAIAYINSLNLHELGLHSAYQLSFLKFDVTSYPSNRRLMTEERKRRGLQTPNERMAMYLQTRDTASLYETTSFYGHGVHNNLWTASVWPTDHLHKCITEFFMDKENYKLQNVDIDIQFIVYPTINTVDLNCNSSSSIIKITDNFSSVWRSNLIKK